MDNTTAIKRIDAGNSSVVLVNRFYWPDQSATSQLLTDLAEHIASSGTKVVIVTSRLRYDSSKERLPPSDRHKNVEIRRVWTTGFDRASLAGRALDFLTFYLFASFALIRIIKKGDIVVAKTDPPLIQVFAWFATWVKRGRLVNWCQDLFPEIVYALAEQRNGGAIGTVLHRLRNFALHRSQMNVTISNEMGKTLIAQGLDHRRVQVIRNWCDPAIEPVSNGANELRRRWKLTDKFVLGYSGNLGRAHIPDKIHLLINELKDIPSLKFLFVGSGHGMKWLRQQCNQEGHKHVIFKPYQPRDTLSLSLSVPNVHLISLRSGCQKFLAPSKFYGILAAGRPIAFLGDRDCELADEIEKTQYGTVLDVNHVQSWRDQVLGLMENTAELATMATNARHAYEAHFTAQASLDAWSRVIERLPTSQTAEQAEATALIGR